jgi:hypothetical protein
MKPTTFAESLRIGRIAEGEISQWLQRLGYAVLPAYEIEINSGKGPQLFSAEGSFVAPDLALIKPGSFLWAEAKRKTVFSWYRQKQRWETGIDIRHFEDYLRVSEITGAEVILFFLHISDTPSDIDTQYENCPLWCPTGLYGNRLSKLKDIGRRSEKWAKGMIYWGEEDLKRYADLSEVIRAEKEAG